MNVHLVKKLILRLVNHYIERAQVELSYSDKIINGDLLRFYDETTGNLISRCKYK